MQHLNWDNLRFVLCVAQSGSVAAAARQLGVNRSTVLRRINNFQDELNCRIFERIDSGYVLTAEAEKMIAAARDVENTLFNLQRQIVGKELSLEGEIRVTTTETFVMTLLGPILAEFHRLHPRIVVDLLTTNDVLDLKRRDADIALRPTIDPDPDLVGRELSKVHFGVYGSHRYLADKENLALQAHRWVGFDATHGGTPVQAWLEEHIPREQFCIRCDSFASIRVAAEHELGLALMPRLLGDASASLRRIDADTESLTVGLWLLTHPDLIRSARIHAFVQHLSDALRKAR